MNNNPMYIYYSTTDPYIIEKCGSHKYPWVIWGYSSCARVFTSYIASFHTLKEAQEYIRTSL